LDVEQQHVEMDVTPKNGVKDSVTDRNAEGDLKFQGKTLQDLLFVEIFAGTSKQSFCTPSIEFSKMGQPHS
jgi:hypothetical protein